MRKIALFVAAAALAGCTEQVPLDVEPSATMTERRAPDLGVCQNLSVGDDHQVALRVFAQGAQIYRWNGTSWTFVAPDAVLTADAGGTGVVGTHYAGPTWESNSGSKVVAAVADRCTPDPRSIPWLLLTAVSSSGPGVFDGVTYIQRINTSGGNAPSVPGDVVNQEAHVPYTTEYVFYRQR